MRQIDPDLEALLEAEGLAHRPGPRPLIAPAIFADLREAIKSCRKVAFDYAGRGAGVQRRRVVCPLGFLYGHRHYLVARDDENGGVKFFTLPAISGLKLLNEPFTRDPDFNIKRFAARSFGVFDEEPVEVVWRFDPSAAPLAREFVFHDSQTLEELADGSLLVRFQAGGQLEMAWHLMSWGHHVEVLAPATLRAMLPEERPTWPALP